jgi:hypothetical protein
MNGSQGTPQPTPAVRHLLDANLLLAAIWSNHPHHAKALA